MTERYARGLGDTNILILLEWLSSEHMPVDLPISTVTLAELTAGVHSATGVLANEHGGSLASSAPKQCLTRSHSTPNPLGNTGSLRVN